MSLKDTWINKTDGVDDVVAGDINSVAQAVISVEDNMVDVEKVANKVTYLEYASSDAKYPSAKAVVDYALMLQQQIYDELEFYQSTENKVTTLSSTSTDAQYPSAKAVVDYVGNIETALDGIIAEQNSIIAIQNTLIGGETV